MKERKFILAVHAPSKSENIFAEYVNFRAEILLLFWKILVKFEEKSKKFSNNFEGCKKFWKKLKTSEIWINYKKIFELLWRNVKG